MASSVAVAAPAKREKSVYMLHDPTTFENIGKFSSTDYRYAANKSASRGFKDILLRKTNTKLVYQYAGDVVDIPPTTVKRGDREITYSKKPKVTFLKKFLYNGELPDDNQASVPENPRADDVGAISAPKAPAKAKRTPKKAAEDAPAPAPAPAPEPATPVAPIATPAEPPAAPKKSKKSRVSTA